MFRNKKGFTLVEVLLVIMVLGILSVVAFTTYIDSTSTFDFLERYKQVISSIRTVRSYAITNVDGDSVERYGVQLTSTTVTAFADDGVEFFALDEADTKISLGTHDFADTPYVISADMPLPITLFYDTGSGDLLVYDSLNMPVSVDQKRYIVLEFHDNNEDISRYIAVFQVSGLAEEFVNEPAL